MYFVIEVLECSIKFLIEGRILMLAAVVCCVVRSFERRASCATASAQSSNLDVLQDGSAVEFSANRLHYIILNIEILSFRVEKGLVLGGAMPFFYTRHPTID